MSKKQKLDPEHRFQFIDDEDLDAKREDLKNKNTVKSNKKANTCFQVILLPKVILWNTGFLTNQL